MDEQLSESKGNCPALWRYEVARWRRSSKQSNLVYFYINNYGKRNYAHSMLTNWKRRCAQVVYNENRGRPW